jgi:hypothetical protein
MVCSKSYGSVVSVHLMHEHSCQKIGTVLFVCVWVPVSILLLWECNVWEDAQKKLCF